MKPLTQYGQMAVRHWRGFLPKMVAELESTRQLHEMLLEAEEKTGAEMDQLRRRLIQQGWTAQQARDSAWEIVPTRYIFRPLELQQKATRSTAPSPTRNRFGIKTTTA